MESAIQIIDENKNFRVEELSTFFKNSAPHIDSICPVITVFGSQSSGKSTLLNHLFDTKFDVMSGDKRAQTTHGIWLAVEPVNHTIILDVEGSDGRERGEDKDFERKAALFSLAVADVLIVNIWENSIGLYNASNINLLKTVLDVYFEIYSSLSSSKTTILFVVRDYVGVTPVEVLESVINEEIQKIWKSIQKPTQHENSMFEDVFVLKFAFLPHKIFKPEEFLISIDKLRERFFSSVDDNQGIFEATSNKRISIQDFPVYSSSIWDVIESSKSLDLPTQQELLAQHRCEETISVIISELKKYFDKLNLYVENNELEKAIEHLKLAVDEANSEYLAKLNRYPIQVVQTKHLNLHRRIKEFVEPLFQKICSKITKKSFQNFELDLKASNQQFSKSSVLEASQRAVTFFRSAIQDFIHLPGGESFNDVITAFEFELDQLSERKLKEFFDKTSRLVCKNFKKDTQPIFSDCFLNANENIWNEIENLYMANIAAALSEFDNLCNSFLELDSFLAAKCDLEELILYYRESIASETSKSSLSMRFTKIMDRKFRFDLSGRPRHWESLVMIDEAFDSAVTQTECLIDTVSLYVPTNSFISAFPSFEKEIIILPEDLKKDFKALIKRDAEIMFLEAKRSLISSSTSIPIWVIVLLVVLGWNEFVTIISSPIYLLMALFVMSSLFVINHLHLNGPILTFAHTILNYLSSPINSNHLVDNKAKDE